MRLLQKIALITVLVIGGSALIYLGAHYWTVTEREVPTVLDRASFSGGDEATRIDNNDPWYDWGFIIGRMAAAVVVGLGLSLFYIAAALPRTKTKHEPRLQA